MQVFEDDLSYVSLNPCLGEKVKVYVDASFGKRSHKGVFGGSGWAIEGDDENLVGYGMNALVAKPSQSSEVWEFRGILGFFQNLKQYRPDLLTKDRHFEIYCDNIGISQDYNAPAGTRPLNVIYGMDYFNFREFFAVTNITFHWVKGHADNIFNTIADRFAYRAYQIAVADIPDDFQRQTFIRSVLMNKDLLPDHEIVTAGDTVSPGDVELWWAAKKKRNFERISANRTFWDSSSCVSVEAELKPGGITEVEVASDLMPPYRFSFSSEGVSPTVVSLTAVRLALYYCWTDGGFDPATSISVYGNCPQACGPVNTVQKGKEPDKTISYSDPKYAQEIVLLKELMRDKNARYIEEKVVLEKLFLEFLR